ncbi:hypothetical protein [Mesorhizobium sp. M0809]|uniref:hypothetical protein n=1 Tax=Mesorhizobium sp. M0809 TaxID=2957003 RepID=UPI003336E58A
MGKHLSQLFNGVIGESGYCVVRTVEDTDDTVVARIVIVADDHLKEFGMLPQHLQDVVMVKTWVVVATRVRSFVAFCGCRPLCKEFLTF